MLSALMNALLTSWKDGHRVALGIFRFLIPIVIIVKVLEESGLIPWIAMPLSPVMKLLGLPAEFSLAWIPCMLVNIYAGLMVLISLVPSLPGLTTAQMTVFGLLVLIAHSLLLEIRIAGLCGVRMPFQLALRLGSALAACWLLHLLLDSTGLLQEKPLILLAAGDSPTLPVWLLLQARNLAQMYVVVCLVMLLQRALEAFGISRFMGKILGPVLRTLGISQKAVSVVIIGFTMGILYGSGALIRNVQEGDFPPKDTLCAISLLGLSHSLIEDTFVLTLVGGSLWGLLLFRLLFTLAAGCLINKFYGVLAPMAVPRDKSGA